MRDTALMIALTHERGFAKPEYDARAVDLGREIDARRNRGWLYMSTQEQVALVRLGKALMAGQDKRVSGTWHVGDGEEAAAAAKLVGRMFDYDTLASGVRFDPEGTPPLYASLERSEEHTSELQSLMRISYAVFCLKKKKNAHQKNTHKSQKLNRQKIAH